MNKKPKDNQHDLVFIHSETKDGEGYNALRSHQGKIDVAELRPVKDGQAIGDGELIKLQQRNDLPNLFDVEVLCEADTEEQSSETRRSNSGPTRVSNNQYRKNWDSVFSPRKTRRSGNKTLH